MTHLERKTWKSGVALGVFLGLCAQGILEILFAIFDYYFPTVNFLLRRAVPPLISIIVVYLAFRGLLTTPKE